MITVTIIAEGYAELQKRLSLAPVAVVSLQQQVLSDLGNTLSDSVREEINGGLDPYGFRWRNLLYYSVQSTLVSPDEVDITQDDEGNFAMYGTRRHWGAKRAPLALELWVMDKFGLNHHEAFPRALAIFRAGTLSPVRAEYPGGARGFQYPAYVVEAKNVKDIDAAATALGNLTVKYLEP